MRVLITGANGRTGFAVARQLKQAGRHTPVAMIRDGKQRARFDEAGIETVTGDLEQPMDGVVKGCDAVIFAAGSGGSTGKDKTVLIDQLGAIRTAVAALNVGAKRFVMLSGLNTSPDATGDPIPHWRRAKGRADDFIRTMPEAFDGDCLDWTIVCPGSLEGDGSDEPGQIKIIDPNGSGKTKRSTLAAVLVACLDHPQTVGRSFGIIDGQTAIAAALTELP